MALQSTIPWIIVESMATIDVISQLSSTKLQVILKHSPICPISAIALDKFQKNFKDILAPMDLYYIDVIDSRPISMAISDRFNVPHESPQLLLIRDNTCVFNESHLMIDVSIIREYLT